MHHCFQRACVAFMAVALVHVHAPGRASADVPDHIRHFEIAQAQSQRSAAGDGSMQVSVSALGRRFDLVLEPSKVLAPGAQTVIVDASGTRTEPTQNTLYRGYLADDAEAVVRVSTAFGALDGMVRTDEETYYLEPLSRYRKDASSRQMIVYRASDIDSKAVPPMKCGADHVAAAAGSAARRSTRSHGGVTGLLELTVIGDYKFTQMHPGNGGQYMQSIINQVDGFYVADVNVTLAIVRTILYTSPGLEPFTSTTDPASLLDQVANARMNDTDNAGDGGLTHLFTGRDLNTNTIGIAYIDALCQPYYGAGLSQNFTLDNHMMTLLLGHELGHNLGAYHDGQNGSPCSAAPNGFIMWPALSASLAEHFSPCSIDTIEPSVDAASCITPAIPPGCGNGLLGIGEDCDDGNNFNGDCCRVDCKFSMTGSFCAGDANQCTDDVCNGLGVCTHPFNNAPCDDGDICTFDGMCVLGSCQPQPDNERPLQAFKLKASFGPESADDKLNIKAALVISKMTSPPTVGGMRLAMRDGTDAILYEAFIPPDRWQDPTGKGTTFRYKDDGTAPPETAGLTLMQIKYRPASGLTKIKGKGALQDLQTLVGQGSVTVRLQVGDDVGGTCAQGLDLDCTSKPTLLSCR